MSHRVPESPKHLDATSGGAASRWVKPPAPAASSPTSPHRGENRKLREEGELFRIPPGRRFVTTPWRVLLAEDDEEMRHLLAKAFHRAGFEVTTCRDGWSLLRRLAAYFLFPELDEADRFDLIVSDVRMPGLTGLEILEGSRGMRAYPPTILITAFGDAETHAAAGRAAVAAFFDKPFDIDLLLQKARELVTPAR